MGKGKFNEETSIDYYKISKEIISYWNSNNMDSLTYHLQTINWIHNYKVTFQFRGTPATDKGPRYCRILFTVL